MSYLASYLNRITSLNGSEHGILDRLVNMLLAFSQNSNRP